MHKSLTIMIGVIISFPLPAQDGWLKTYGYDKEETGFVVQQTSDEGFIIFGYTTIESGNSDIWLLKTDINGDTTWTKTYGGEELEFGYAGQQTSDNGYIIAGLTESFSNGGFDAWLIKTDEKGDTVWSKTYGGDGYDIASSIQETDDGGFIFTGFKDGPNKYIPGDMWLVKTNPDGDLSWEQTYGSVSLFDLGSYVSQTSDAGYIVACFIQDSVSPGEDNLILIMKTDASGDSLWAYSGEAYSFYCIKETPNENYIATGQTTNDDLVIVKLDSDGGLLWEKIYGDMREDYRDVGRCVQVTSDDNYIVSGLYSRYLSEGGDAWLLKVNPQGDTLWTRLFGENPQYDNAYWVQQTSDGGYILTGTSESWTSEGRNLFLVKTDSLGNVAIKEKPLIKEIHDLALLNPIGSKIELSYKNMPEGFHARIFDVTGCKVDELHSVKSSGVLRWGSNHEPGVYFIRSVSNTSFETQKVVLIR